MEINQFKKHIQNIIAGNNISKGELVGMYADALKEQINKRIERYLKDSAVEKIINDTIHRQIAMTISKHLQPVDVWYKNSPNQFQVYVEREIQKQVQELIKNSIKVEVVKPN